MQPLSIVRVDVQGLEADATAVEELARVALRLRRCGYRLTLLGPSDELLGLIELCGLSQALPADPSTAGSAPQGW